MSDQTLYYLQIVGVVAGVTFLTRIAPFLFFRKGKTPDIINYLGKALPPSVMAMLLVYCLRGTGFTAFPFGLPEIIACTTVVVLHLLKRSNLLSILGGTVVYMLCVQLLFVV